jgi:hypothetical protein
MLRTGDINYVTVDAAGLIGASERHRNRILSIKPVNVISFRIVNVCRSKGLPLACMLRVIITIMTSVLKTFILWHFKPQNVYPVQQYLLTLKRCNVGPEPFLRLQQGNLPLCDVVNTD